MSKYTFISPHLDDAVFSCGQLIDHELNCEVVTVFAGIPPKTKLTPYDEKCGFRSSRAAMEQRRDEDIRATHHLGAAFTHLNFLDSQYGVNDYSQIQDELNRLIRECDIVVAPLGLLHHDHTLARNVVIDLMESYPEKNLLLYEELPYRVIYPEKAQDEVNKLRENFELTLEVPTSLPSEGKLFACSRYESQLKTGDINLYTVMVPERYWRVR